MRTVVERVADTVRHFGVLVVRHVVAVTTAGPSISRQAQKRGRRVAGPFDIAKACRSGGPGQLRLRVVELLLLGRSLERERRGVARSDHFRDLVEGPGAHLALVLA